jgi:hypothetical protein
VHDALRSATSAGASTAPSRATTLSVGVVLTSRELPAWQHAVLSRIAASGFATLTAVLPPRRGADAPRPRGLTAMLRRLVERLEAKMVCEIDAYARVDAAALLEDVAAIDSEAAARALDVLIDFSGAPSAPELAAFARCGVWRYAQPYSASADAAEAAFWPVYHCWPTGEVVLEMCSADGTSVPLGRASPATHPHSMKLTASAMGWRMASLLGHKLRELHEVGIAAFTQRAAEQGSKSDVGAARAPPGAGALAVYAGRNVARRARASAERRLTCEQWILMCRRGAEPCTDASQFTKIVPPKTCFWADPHLVAREGRYYAFVEEYPYATGKGRIAVLEIDADGVHSAATPVLERDYHLSYPFVFEHGGELYMVPESSENRTVDLYRCTGFPLHWEHVETLLPDVAATDTTLLRRDGRWWLFTNLIDFDGASFSEELYIFHSETLVGGEWKAHRRNPVISDARRARPAGAFIERGGRVLRPAQDCSVRYGYAIRLHEIVTLTEDVYLEKEVARIEPTWDRRIVATHTLAYVPGLTMIDALQPRLRF